ncbi:Crp/Fnr family transcriptional regulator [Hymenobacter seoulensis]
MKKTPTSGAVVQLTALLTQLSALSPEEVTAFVGRWQPAPVLMRGEFLIQPGQVERTLYFISQGLVRIFFPTETEEICVGFGYDTTLVCAFPSFVNHQPSEYAIQALRRTELLAISRAEFMAFVEESPRFAQFWRAELERNLVGRIEREIDLLLPDPAQRYQRLQARSPQLLQRVPRKYIASYLRMTPETLSRLH